MGCGGECRSRDGEGWDGQGEGVGVLDGWVGEKEIMNLQCHLCNLFLLL